MALWNNKNKSFFEWEKKNKKKNSNYKTIEERLGEDYNFDKKSGNYVPKDSSNPIYYDYTDTLDPNYSANQRNFYKENGRLLPRSKEERDRLENFQNQIPQEYNGVYNQDIGGFYTSHGVYKIEGNSVKPENERDFIQNEEGKWIYNKDYYENVPKTVDWGDYFKDLKEENLIVDNKKNVNDADEIVQNQNENNDELKKINENLKDIQEDLEEENSISASKEEENQIEEESKNKKEENKSKNKKDNDEDDEEDEEDDDNKEESDHYILAGLASLIPVLGGGLSILVDRLLEEARIYDLAERKFRSATGGGVHYRSLTDIGLTDAEAFEKLTGYYSQNINLRESDLEFEKGYNASSGLMSSLLRSFREDILKEMGASVVGVNYLQELTSRGGIDSKKVRGYTEDYLKILIDLNQKQLEVVGSTESILSSKIIQGIASLDEKLTTPTTLNRIIQGLESGLVQAKSPQIEALQYYALAQANPSASIWEMQLMKENPFGSESKGYLSNFLTYLFSTGNLSDVKFNIMNTFGLSAHNTENLVNGILKIKEKVEKITPEDKDYEEYKKYKNINGEFDLSKYLESEGFEELEFIKENGSNKGLEEAKKQILKEAGAATSPLQREQAKIANVMAELGMPLLELQTEVVDLLEDIVSKVPGFVDSAGNFVGEVSDLVSNAGNFMNEFWDSLGNTLKNIVPDFSGITSFIEGFWGTLGKTIRENTPDWVPFIDKENNTNPQQE